jgi:nitroreductase
MLDKNDFYSLIENRKSIRKFKTTPVPKDVLERLMGAAIQAPSGKNRQNWRFYVVQGKKRDQYLQFSQKSWLGIKDILKIRLKPSLYDFTERFFFTLGDAPVLVFAFSHNSDEEKYLTSVGSVYMAVENLNLACIVEGLGCCTMGAPLEIKDDVIQFLGLSEHPHIKSGEMELLCGIVLGYPDHNPPKAPRISDDRVHWLD